jgi:IS30 family transposase
VTPPRTSRAIGGRVDLDRVEKLIDSRYLSLLEREQLHDLRRTGMSIRTIATGDEPLTIDHQPRTAAQHSVGSWGDLAERGDDRAPRL